MKVILEDNLHWCVVVVRRTVKLNASLLCLIKFDYKFEIKKIVISILPLLVTIFFSPLFLRFCPFFPLLTRITNLSGDEWSSTMDNRWGWLSINAAGTRLRFQRNCPPQSSMKSLVSSQWTIILFFMSTWFDLMAMRVNSPRLSHNCDAKRRQWVSVIKNFFSSLISRLRERVRESFVSYIFHVLTFYELSERGEEKCAAADDDEFIYFSWYTGGDVEYFQRVYFWRGCL